MPLLIIAFAVFVFSATMLLKKAQNQVLGINVLIFLIYEAVLISGGIGAEKWGQIAWFFAAAVVGVVHLLVLFILALVLPDLTKVPKKASAKKAPARVPANKTATRRPQARPASKGRRIVVRQPEAKKISGQELSSAERRAREYFDDRKGGELAFED